MDLKDIKELMNAMRRTGTKRVRVKKKDSEIELERESNEVHKIVDPSLMGVDDMAIQRANYAFAKGGAATTTLTQPPELEAKKEESLVNVVTSPLVGTFYANPSPEDPPFIKVGDTVDKDTVLCIVEAMKVMNEVKAGVSGVVAEVLVENGHPVEFGTKLFRIK